MSNKTSGFKRAIGIVLDVITMLVLIALFVVLVMAPIPNIWVDKVAASDNAIDQTVSPTQSETYCPAPIGLADTGTYGDSAFQATVGNLSTQARYAAFGSVYSATVSAIGQKSSSDDVTLKDADSTDDSSVKTGAQKINQGARLINTRMLQAAAGTGTVGTIASWADDGDVRPPSTLPSGVPRQPGKWHCPPNPRCLCQPRGSPRWNCPPRSMGSMVCS